MKITKQLEAEIIQLMDDYWNSYFEGDLSHWSNYLPEDYRNIGGTEEEIWNSKQEILDYTYKVIDQMQGNTALRNKQTQIIPYDPYIMVHELLDIFIKVEGEWMFYQKFRLSSLIQKTGEGWKVLHQHGSYPDSKTSEGEAIAFDTLKSENIKLQKAIKERTHELEQRNNELAVEAALEKVRAVAMGMRKPDDMLRVCKTLSDQLLQLGFEEIRNVQTVIIYEPIHQYLNYQYFTLYNEESLERIDYLLHPEVLLFTEKMLQSSDAYYTKVFEGEELKTWREYRKMTNQLPDPKLDATTSAHYYFYSIGAGALGVTTYAALTEEQVTLFQRFRNVFQLAYSRFVDIELALAQAREAQIEAGLERVRSRSLAMHHTSELQQIIHTVHKELLHLNIAIHGGSFIAINSDIDTSLRCWGSGGTANTSSEVDLPYYEKPFCSNLVKGIKKGSGFFTEEFSQEEKKEFFTFLFNYKPWSELDDRQKEETLLSQGGYTRSCCVSNHTTLFIINHFGEKFSDTDNDILIRFSKVFEQAYTRFLDLQKAEAQARIAEIHLLQIQEEKHKAELALAELQAAQKQLVQSEKMASLGELTAGIAHEIQNPLNFVNNFSDVNTELIEELEEEIAQGNIEEVKAIASDIKQNELKINHHGKRADAIVKGMLQHSRANTGKKELTDINALADEYLRLSYHGLRAKDKSFNSNFTTNFDESMGSSEVVPQDIGRVLLNLYNNAFYSVNEKKKQLNGTFQPSVAVSTIKSKESFAIMVKDNGNGIPQKVVDKIYQPFFTTKPTGEGTGLGLSLSYDIIKAHGGEMKVETKEGEGAEFIIQLPV